MRVLAFPRNVLLDPEALKSYVIDHATVYFSIKLEYYDHDEIETSTWLVQPLLFLIFYPPDNSKYIYTFSSEDGKKSCGISLHVSESPRSTINSIFLNYCYIGSNIYPFTFYFRLAKKWRKLMELDKASPAHQTFHVDSTADLAISNYFFFWGPYNNHAVYILPLSFSEAIINEEPAMLGKFTHPLEFLEGENLDPLSELVIRRVYSWISDLS